jgi:cytosine/adenosine deaminase-related metal-dependent hydrolase
MATQGLDRRALLAATAASATLVAASEARAQTSPAPNPRDRETILIRGATIVSMDPSVGTLANGDILIERGVIRAIGTGLAAPADALVIDGAGKIACPGFVNGHIHLPQVLQRGLSADHSFTDYFRNIVLRYSNRMTVADVALGVRAGGLEQMSVGTTTIVDWNREVVSPDHADAAVESHLASGARVVFCYTVPLRPQDGSTPNHARMMSHAKTLKAGKLASGRVSLGVCLPGPDFMPLEPALGDLTMLKELGVLTAFHCGAPIYAARKKRTVATLAERGLLDANTQLVHANDLEIDEYKIAADKGAKLSSTPEAEMHMGHGFAAIGKARDAGLAVSLGTDIPSAFGGSMLEQARLAYAADLALRNQASFAATGKPPEVKPWTARAMLEVLTIGGAKAVGLDRVTGSLTVGKRADILLIDGLSAGVAPVLDPIGAIMLQASVADIGTVIVDGRVQKFAGKLTDPALPQIIEQVRTRSAAMVEAAKQ